MKKTKKRYYRANATLTDGVKEWNVIIYSMYESVDEAEEGIKHFSSKGYNIVRIVRTWID